MKKLALSLLLSTAFFANIKTITITTDFGPIQIITNNGSSTFGPGTVNFYGNINIGQSSSDIIKIQGSGISYPSSGTSFLMIDTSGNVVTAGGGSSTFNCGNLIAAPSTGQSVTLGQSAKNYLTFTADSGNMTIKANNPGANLNLSANSHITISSPDITNPSSGTSFLMIDTSGNVVTAGGGSSTFNCGNLIAAPSTGQSVTLGQSAKNYLTFTADSGNMTIKANNPGANLGLSANSHITISSADITNPSTGTSFLMIDTSGNVVTAGGGSSTFNCGNLIAAPSTGQSVTLGQSAKNYLTFTADSGNIVIQANTIGGNLSLTTNGHIVATSPDIAPIANMTGLNILAIDRAGNIVSSHSNNLFKIGSDATGKNFIAIDNIINNNGILLNSANVYLQGQALSPAAGSTNILTIDSNGKIGIVLSARAYKKDIRGITTTNGFDSIRPVAYSYLNSNNTEYGLIAEDLEKNELLKHAVIYAPDGNPMSINYQTILIAMIADYLETKKELKSIKQKLNKRDELSNELIKKCNELETKITELNQKIQNKE